MKLNCLNGGICSEKAPGSFACECLDGYEGKLCGIGEMLFIH